MDCSRIQRPSDNPFDRFAIEPSGADREERLAGLSDPLRDRSSG
jgi:hypothetical protein